MTYLKTENSQGVVSLLLQEAEIWDITKEKDNLPLCLQANSAICSAMQQYRKDNLRKLSIEMMYYIHNTVLPNMVAEEKKNYDRR